MSDTTNLGSIIDKTQVLRILQEIKGTSVPGLRLWVADRDGMPVLGESDSAAVGYSDLVARVATGGQSIAEKNLAAAPILVDGTSAGALVGSNPGEEPPPRQVLEAWARILATAIRSELEKQSLAKELIHRYQGRVCLACGAV